MFGALTGKLLVEGRRPVLLNQSMCKPNHFLTKKKKRKKKK